MMEFKEVNVLEPAGEVQVYRNYWWWCVDGDPKRALFYARRKHEVGSPQCNFNKAVAEVVGKKLEQDSIAQLIQIPLAFVPWEG